MELLWAEFLNSDWHDWRGSGQAEDRLDKPEWLARFLAHFDLPPLQAPQPQEVAALKEMRDRLRLMAVALASGGAPGVEDVAWLNLLLQQGPVARQVAEEGRRLQLVPLRQDWPQFMAEVAASFAHTLAEGEGTRVRVCENPDCLWVFYDDTRNRTKRFCDDKMCGNLMKVRRFRARKRATTEE